MDAAAMLAGVSIETIVKWILGVLFGSVCLAAPTLLLVVMILQAIKPHRPPEERHGPGFPVISKLEDVDKKPTE